MQNLNQNVCKSKKGQKIASADLSEILIWLPKLVTKLYLMVKTCEQKT